MLKINWNNETRHLSSHSGPDTKSNTFVDCHPSVDPNALADVFDMTRQAVSKHIKILNECELLLQEKIGRKIYYQLKVDKMKEIDKWLNQFRKAWETSFNQFDEVLLTIKNKK